MLKAYKEVITKPSESPTIFNFTSDLTGKTREERNTKLSKTEKLFTFNLSRKIERKNKDMINEKKKEMKVKKLDKKCN